MANSIFDQFTGKYSLSKTLRFELRVPSDFPGTKAMLEKEDIFEKDKSKRRKYEETKTWIDDLHREFIDDSLKDFSFRDLRSYRVALTVWQNAKKDKKAKETLLKEEKKLRDEIVAQFDETASVWTEQYPQLRLKKNDVGVLFEAGVFDVMKEKYSEREGIMVNSPDGKKVNIFDGWKGWTSYFNKFFTTRRNFYSAGDKSTAISYRIVNQNLRRFCKNLEIYEDIKGKVDLKGTGKNLGISFEQVFSLENYNACLLQDGIDRYNKVIGGFVGENDSKVPGINQSINEYRQKNNGDKLPFLVILDKQIHSEKEQFFDEIKDETQLIKHLSAFMDVADKKLELFRNLIADLAFYSSLYDLGKIYIDSSAFERNAGRWFADYAAFEDSLLKTSKEFKDAYTGLDLKWTDKDGQIKYPDFVLCSHIKKALEKLEGNIFKDKYYGDGENEAMSGFSQLGPFEQFIRVIQYEVDQQFHGKDSENNETGYNICRSKISDIINLGKSITEAGVRADIKDFADTALTIYQIAKYFAVEKKRRWLDNFDLDDRFYKTTDSGYLTFYEDAYSEIVQGYNRLRNYLTKKPYSTDKWVLNFDIQTLADGWDKNKEKDNGAVIMRKDGRYYLGIMHRDNRNLFLEKNKHDYTGDGFEKMEYKQISNPAFDIYNFILNPDGTAKRSTKKETKQNEWPKNIVDIYNKKSYAKENFNRKDFETFVDYIKKCALLYWKDYNISFSPTSAYKNISDFTAEIDQFGYKVAFTPVSEQYVRGKSEAGELFVFEIHNKDWNLKDGEKKTGAKNIHTIYWEHLFSKENADLNFVFKLNGEAELFFRPKIEENKLGYKIKDTKTGKWKNITLKTNESVPEGAIVDRRRYSQDKVFFHCPITLNRVSENRTGRQMNADIRKSIENNKELRIIGIDRGEKHLAYYSVINQDGKIIEGGSLNTIGTADGKSVPYAEILEKRAEDRENARREWRDIEAIKDLKKGYVSQVVRKLADLAVKHPNAIIVLEDLNMRFKQVRGGIEKSIYQQLEKQLIDKLSFLVNKKETDPTKSGHPLKAFQLASPIKSFKDMGKQTGILFYTAAGYTSRTCPCCGYRRNIQFRFENIKKAEEKFKLFDDFIYDSKNDMFKLTYSLRKLVNKEYLKPNKTKNKLYENVDRKDKFTLNTKDAIRYKWFQNGSPRLRAIEKYQGVVDDESVGMDEQATKRGKTKKFNITAFIKCILEKGGIPYNSSSLQDDIVAKRSKELYEKIFFAFYLLSETRQTISGTKKDDIYCPECDFDSIKGFQDRKEFNGDANGAYNIARKGLMILEKIRQFGKSKDIAEMGWGELSISIEEWDKFTQTQWNPTSKSQK